MPVVPEWWQNSVGIRHPPKDPRVQLWGPDRQKHVCYLLKLPVSSHEIDLEILLTTMLDFLHVVFPSQSSRGPPHNVFYSFKKWEISFVKCSNSGNVSNVFFHHQIISSKALCHCILRECVPQISVIMGSYFLGSAPLGPARPGAGEEVPRCDPGLLHNPLLLWRAQWRFHCQRQWR